MGQNDQIVPNALQRTTSCKNTNKVTPAGLTRSSTTTSALIPAASHHTRRPPVRLVSSLLRSLLSVLALPTCRWLGNIPPPAGGFIPAAAAPSLGRKVTGTLFGRRRCHVSFAVQDDPRSEPALVIELAVSTSALVREMSSGLVRIALECERRPPAPALYGEASWTMYCNGRKCGYAAGRACAESDRHVLRTVGTVSVGAGVIPVSDGGGEEAAEGEVMYMRARFERVVGSRDSEAFYMLNPDGGGGPELSIFLLRI
ncbi:Protein MIZU-KUSSEI 1 [Striga hermonthica]|uniref:Protein MIZU-KUSSEI 1 n=1 Tax=Striga hermonthica TaxID=68872 RepID=A0A9N7R578_STRHE|nr:Protein MIZU-KUSSEI 1 [Striga hermonthica]